MNTAHKSAVRWFRCLPELQLLSKLNERQHTQLQVMNVLLNNNNKAHSTTLSPSSSSMTQHPFKAVPVTQTKHGSVLPPAGRYLHVQGGFHRGAVGHWTA